MDGARLFNAAVALGLPASALAAEVDSVMFCLSKGLSAPVGSMLAGSRDFIAEARRVRKLLGGGMRQAGIIAAAGIVALTEMVDRLAEDHANARHFANGLADLPGVAIQPETVETNILFFGMTDAEGRIDVAANMALTQAAAQAGLLLSSGDDGRIRAVTHYGVERADVDRALTVIHRVMEARV